MTSVGSAWYQSGGLPAEIHEAISVANAEGEASAYETLSEGMAWAIAMRTDC